MPGRKPKDYLIECRDDGLPTADVGPWAAEKYRRVGMYLEIFSTGMKARWDSRVYLDLFAGPGVSKVRTTGRLVMGSPLIGLSLPTRFDRYIFADRNQEALDALRQRVEAKSSTDS